LLQNAQKNCLAPENPFKFFAILAEESGFFKNTAPLPEPRRRPAPARLRRAGLFM
jgi:hypothetical protein